MGCRQSEGRCMSGLALELWFVVGQGPGVEPRCTVSRELTSRRPGCNLTPERAISWLSVVASPVLSHRPIPQPLVTTNRQAPMRKTAYRSLCKTRYEIQGFAGRIGLAVWRAPTNRLGRFQ